MNAYQMNAYQTLASTLKFPVYLEGRESETHDWELVYEAKDAAEFEFKITSYKHPVYPLMRARDSRGGLFEVSQEQIMKIHEIVTKENLALLEPLRAFVNSVPEKAVETASELVRAGHIAKHFAITPDSRVVLGHPNLHLIRVTEFEDSVVCRLRLDDGPPTETEPSITIWTKSEALGKFGVVPEALGDPIKAFLCLLCASIVRDFWVLENRTRQRTYQTRTEKKRERVGTGKERQLKVEKLYTFIPRFQYDLNAYQDRAKEVSHQTRVTLSPHLVSGHFRKLPADWKASDEAREHAREFGLTLTEGYTFVRPHERGEIEQMRTYRSRSAFELIFGEEDI